MKSTRMVCFLALCLVACLTMQASAQTVGNPGFEDPIVDMGSAVGNWFGFSGGGAASAENSNIQPHSGAQHLYLTIPGVDNNFAGAFQDVMGVSPGQTVNYSVWHKSDGTFDIGAELRIEWRNPANTAEVARTPNSVPTLTSDYAQYTLSAVVPPGAGGARLVYAIQSFGSGGTNTGTVFVDDVTLSVVPEPATIGLLGCAAVALLAARRRS